MRPATRLTHVILTRFAVRLSPDAPLPSREWLARRCDLFERFCLPSIESQPSRDFTWLLFVDPELDAPARARIDAYASRLEQVRVREVSHANALDEMAAAAMQSAPRERVQLLTSRLDNDDAVSADYLPRLLAAVAATPENETRAYVFTSGFELAGSRLYWRPFPRSPFASLVEPVTEAPPATIMAAEHELIDSLAPVTEIGSPAAWVQVVHGDNVLNRVRGIRVPLSRLRRRFRIDDPSAAGRESLVSLAIGVPASMARLAADLAGNPRYRAKVAALLRSRAGR